jgi:hypothetical protein
MRLDACLLASYEVAKSYCRPAPSARFVPVKPRSPSATISRKHVKCGHIDVLEPSARFVSVVDRRELFTYPDIFVIPNHSDVIWGKCGGFLGDSE